MRSALVNAATVFFCAAAVSAADATGTDYPTKPIRVITGNTGATADILARQVARRLTERWGIPRPELEAAGAEMVFRNPAHLLAALDDSPLGREE